MKKKPYDTNFRVQLSKVYAEKSCFENSIANLL